MKSKKTARILALNLALRPESPVKIFPIGLSYVLSSVKRAGYELELFDIDLDRPATEAFHRKLGERAWDVVLLGCIVTGYRIVKSVVADIRRMAPQALVVVGNSVASSIPEILLTETEADVAVIGEGDQTVIDVLDNWFGCRSLEGVRGIWYKKDGAVIANKPRPVIENIDDNPNPIYDLFNAEAYITAHINNVNEPFPCAKESIRAFPVNTARGCINRCTFCYHCFIGEKYRHRSSRSIVDEIKDLRRRYGINYALLWDDLTFFSKKHIEDFVDLLLDENIEVYWAGAVRGNLFQTEDDLPLLEKMKKAGCQLLGYALESADPDILREMKKKVSLKKFGEQKRLMDRAGIASGTSIVLGYPGETPESIGKTFQFLIDIGLYPSIGFLLPQPGTPIYQWAIDNGKIPDEEAFLLRLGDRQDLRINLTRMSDQEFLDVVFYWSSKANRELGLGLDDTTLIKTGHRREKGRESNKDEK